MILPKALQLLIYLVIGSSVLFSGERIQISPHGFYEIDLRFEHLAGNQRLRFGRPWYDSNLINHNSLYINLQPILLSDNSGVNPELSSWIQARLGERLLIINEMKIYYASQNESSYAGKEWRDVSGLTNQSFLRWTKLTHSGNSFILNIGRMYNQLGQGRHGQLLMGVESRPLDQFSFNYHRALNNSASINFFYQTAMLDKVNSANRYISLHRLQLSAHSWYIAVTEGLLFSRVRGGVDAAYLNPFTFYHLEQLNGPGLEGNTMGSLEFGFYRGQSHIYTELLIDDIQLDHAEIGDLEPNEIGLLLGFETAYPKMYINLETVAITNRTYKTNDPTEWFVHRNVPLGYELGSDLGRFNILTRYYPKNNWHLDAQLDLIWQGEGDMSHPWDTPWEDELVTMETGYAEPFPTGTVYSSSKISFEVMRHWTRERWFALGCYYKSEKNVEHITGESQKNLGLSLSASWTLDYEIPLD